MADIIFKYPEMDQAAKQIDNIANNYRQAATNFLMQMDNATMGWTGASREAFMNYVNTTVKDYIENTIPQVVDGLAAMLRANAEQMQSVDEEIAQQIRNSMTGNAQ